MNSETSIKDKKIKRRSFFYYIGAASLGGALLSLFPFRLLKKYTVPSRSSSLKVTENPFAVKRNSPPGERGKGPVNG